MRKILLYTSMLLFVWGVSTFPIIGKTIHHEKKLTTLTGIVDSADLDYWEIKNETNHRTITIASDKETVEIEPGETKKVYRTKNFNFSAGYPDRYNDKKNKQQFIITDHAISVYSRYFGKQSKLQFLIGITKKSIK